MASLPPDCAPKTPANTLDLRVTVRRAYVGSQPYRWEVNRGDLPLHVSPGRFRSMAAAYEAGQNWLADYIVKQRPVSPRPRGPRTALARHSHLLVSHNDKGEDLDVDYTTDGPHETPTDLHSSGSEAA